MEEGGGAQHGAKMLENSVTQVMEIFHLPGATDWELLETHLLQPAAQSARINSSGVLLPIEMAVASRSSTCLRKKAGSSRGR
jgi:hypothetical protein